MRLRNAGFRLDLERRDSDVTIDTYSGDRAMTSHPMIESTSSQARRLCFAAPTPG